MSQVVDWPLNTSTTADAATNGQGWHVGAAPPAMVASPSLNTPEVDTSAQPPTDLACFATRNPTKPVIQPSHSYHKPAIDKLTKSLKKQQRDENQKSFDNAIRDCITHRNKEIEALAHTHGRTKQYIREVLNNETHYRQERDVNMYNAKIHWKATELNTNCPSGNRVRLAAIIQAVEEDASLKNPSEEQKQEMMRLLREHREVHKKGARVDNRAANHDFQNTVDRMNKEMDLMSERIGAIGFGVFTRGHINDMSFACWGQTQGVDEFFVDVLGMTPGELSRKLDAWAVARSDRDQQRPEKILDLQAECSKIVLAGLREKTNKPSISMAYTKYDTEIRLVHEIQLVGWPNNVKFLPPAKLTAKSDVLILLDALREGECFWKRMTPHEIRDLKAKLKGGEVIAKTRAPRSDKGGTHNKRKRRNEGNEERIGHGVHGRKKTKPTGKSAASQLPPMQNCGLPAQEESDASDNT